MPKDIITDGAARVGLLTGTLVLAHIPGKSVGIAAGGAAIPFRDTAWEERTGKPFESCGLSEYLVTAEFGHVAGLVSEALAHASLENPDAFHKITSAILNGGTAGHVLLAPPRGQWPDAAYAAIGWASAGKPAGPVLRCFPSLPVLDLISATVENMRVPPDPGFLDQWCHDNPDTLVMAPGVDDSIEYMGWNASLNRRTIFRAVLVDFTKPWRVTEMPDGSEEVVPAQPLVLLDGTMNCYALA